MNADPEVMRYIGRGRAMTREESDALSARLGEHWETHGFGLWALLEKPAARFVGFAGLSHPTFVPELAHEVEVGWRLRRDAWGHGYATEAAVCAVKAGFERLGLERIISLPHAQNERSRRVAERIGLAFERLVTHPQYGFDLAVYLVQRER
jgi:RimJ/RimL family protein N-acetyltransferase